MRQIILGAVGAIALAVSAQAADLAAGPGGLKDNYVPAASWTGFYFGAHVGALYQGGNLTLGGTDRPGPDMTFDPNLGTLNAIGGLVGGYNYQVGSMCWVLKAMWGGPIRWPRS